MSGEHDLAALLNAYIDGDVLARKVLVDALEETGDPRAEKIREEDIDWGALATRLAESTEVSGPYYIGLEANRIRFYIECARYGSPTHPEVIDAVRAARRAAVAKLFPEVQV